MTTESLLSTSVQGLPSSNQISSNSRLVGVAAPQRQQQQQQQSGVNSLSSLLAGSHGVIQASSVGTPLHLMVRTDPIATASNRGPSSWASANVNNPTQPVITLDQWQLNNNSGNRVPPLASPEVITTATTTNSTTTSNNTTGGAHLSSSSTASSSNVQPPRISATSRFYCAMTTDIQQPATTQNYEARSSGSVSGSYSVPQSRFNNNGSSNYASNPLESNEPSFNVRPQTFHATATVPFPTSGNNNLLFPIARQQPLTQQPSSSSTASYDQTASDETSTVTNNTPAEELTDGSNLDMSGISSGDKALLRNVAGQSFPSVTNISVPPPSSAVQLSPLELVEQLNRLLTVGDIALGMPQPQHRIKVAKLHRRAGFVLDNEGNSNNSGQDSGSSSSSQHNSPRDLAARRLRSVSMPLVQVGASSKSQFDSTMATICGERLSRHLKAVRHFDLQSVKFSLGNALSVLEQVSRTAKTPSNLNTTTGASAATLGSVRLYDDLSSMTSGGTMSSNGPPSTQVAPELRDQGDGKSNTVVQSCPYFRNEISTEEVRAIHLGRATVAKQIQRLVSSSQQNSPVDPQQNGQSVSHPICNAITVLDRQNCPISDQLRQYGGFRAFSSGFVVEHHDFGAHFYRDCFVGKEHRNYLANHPIFGPIVVSLLRERISVQPSQSAANLMSRSGFSLVPSQNQCQYQHKVIVRTADMVVLRGILPEDTVPYVHKNSSKKHAKDQQGPSPSDIISFLLPEVNGASIFRHETEHERVETELIRIDEQNVRYKYKFGVIYCRPGQSSEEEFYNNPSGSPLFDDFLNLLGRRVQLHNFAGYAGGLDTKQDTTGQDSVYASFGGFEVMFHVSTLLPFSPTNKQQLLRKRHIGNDVVTIIFQEPGSQPFTPRAIRSQYQHIFIVVRPILCTTTPGQVVGYQVAVSRAKDSSYFGPLLPPDGVFAKSREFGEFLLAKAINAENAVVKSGKFVTMALRTRRELLLDLVNSYASQEAIVQTENGVNGSNGSHSNGGGFAGASRLMRLSFRRVFRDKTSFFRGNASDAQKNLAQSQPSLLTAQAKILNASGAYAWNVVLVDCGQGGRLVQSTLVVSTDDLIVLDRESVPVPVENGVTPSSLLQSPVVFCVPLKAILGYRVQHTDLRLYYHKGESILLRSVDGSIDEIEEIVSRIGAVAGSVEYVPAVHSVNEVALTSPVGLGRFGFLCSAQGVVLRVDDGGPASNCGLRPGCRIIEVFGIALRALTGSQLRELFQSAQRLTLSVLPALPSGSPRQSRVQPDTPTLYWLPQYFHAMSPEFLSQLPSKQPEIEVAADQTPQPVEPNQATPRSSAGSYANAINNNNVTSTPVAASFAQNRIYAELPIVPTAGNNKSIFEPRIQPSDSLEMVPTTTNGGSNNGSEPYYTPAGSRRPLLLPATTASSYSPIDAGSAAKSVLNNSNYQLHRWPMNGGGPGTPNSGGQPQSQKSSSGELVDLGQSQPPMSTVGLLEAQLAVERSRRLAAEHELAETRAQLLEMRQVVKQFTDWFISVPAGAAVAASPQQRQKMRQWQSSLAAMAVIPPISDDAFINEINNNNNNNLAVDNSV